MLTAVHALRVLGGVIAQPALGAPQRLTEGPAVPWGGVSLGTGGYGAVAHDFDGTNHVVVWTDGRAPVLFAARVTTAGVLLDPAGIPIRTGGPLVPRGDVALAFDGTHHLLVFAQLTTRGGFADRDLVALRLGRDLLPIESTPIVLSSQALPMAPAVAFDGDRFVVAWSAGSAPSGTSANTGRYYARVTPDGRVLEPGGRAIDIGSSNPGSAVGRLGVACAAGTSAFVWQSARELRGELYVDARLRRLGPDGRWVDPSPVLLAEGLRYGSLPSIASNGQRFLVAWNEGLYSGQARVSTRASRIDPTGPPLDAPAPTLVSGGTELLSAGPTAAWTGAGWAIVSTPGSGTVGFLMSDAGAVRGPVALTGLVGPRYPLLAFDGGALLWIATSYESPGLDYVRALRLDAELRVLDPTPIEISRASPYQYDPVVASSGDQALVAWFEHRGSWASALRAARIDATGRSLDPGGVELAVATDSGHGFVTSAASWDGRQYVVAWIGDGPASPREYAQLVRVSRTGQRLDATSVPIWTRTAPYDLGVASSTSGVSLVCVRPSAPGDLRCLRFGPDGAPMDGADGLLLAEREVTALAVGHAAGRFLVAWNTAVSGAPGSLRLRSVDPATGTLGPPNTVSTEVHWARRPWLASGGQEALLAWTAATGGLQASGLRATRVGPSGPGPSLSFGPEGFNANAAGRDGDWLLSWSAYQPPPGLTTALARRLGPGSGFREPAFDLARGEISGAIAIAPLADGFVAAWSGFVEDPLVNNGRILTRLVGVTAPAPVDAGVPLDAGALDAGPELDAGTPGDAGPGLDAGAPTDAGAAPDGGLGPLRFLTEPVRSARCGVEYVYAARAEGAGPVDYALSERPSGMTLETDGTLRWTPTGAGSPAVELLASDGRETVRQLYNVEVECEALAVLHDDCDCRASGRGDGLDLGLGLLLLGLASRRRRVGRAGPGRRR